MSKHPYLVGITGGIGAGKSTVCRVFEWLGIPVYYADAEAKVLINTDLLLRAAIKSLLGKRSYSKDGQYDSKVVAALVFKNAELLEQLNQIIHPAVANHFQSWIADHRKSAYVLKEAAILFESGSHIGLNAIIGVQAPMAVRISRTMSRDSIKASQVEARINNQMSQEEKMKKCDYVIFNDGERMIIPQVMSVHKKLIAQAKM